MIEQANFTYSPLGKALDKQKKNDWRSKIIANRSNERSMKTTG